MDPQTDPANAIALLEGLLTNAQAWAEFYFNMLLRPWIRYQVLIAVTLLAVAWGVGSLARPRLHDWMRGREGWPRWRMRVLVIVHRRLRMIFFVALMWIAVLIMREVTWPSRSYLLAIFANLAAAWLFVVFATRLIDNPLLRTTVRYGAWIWVTLSILGLTADTQRLLEGLAITLGDMRW